MLKRKNILLAFAALVLFFAFFNAPSAQAGGKEYEKIVKHLKTKYQAKKVKIPMMWLARFAVRVIRPAGVKSFSMTTFENLSVAPATLDAEMQAAMRNSMGEEWSPILRVRSRQGEQAYLYMREAKESVRIMLVTIDKGQAAVIRAAFVPEKLADFMNDPKIFGVSLSDDRRADNQPPKPTAAIEEKSGEPKKDN